MVLAVTCALLGLAIEFISYLFLWMKLTLILIFQLIHDTVIDTSIVFPHTRGPPYKKGLKKLILDHFQKHIQKDGIIFNLHRLILNRVVFCFAFFKRIGGHNSAEDAIACMELMIGKVKPLLR